LVERHGISITVSECEEILRKIAQDFAWVLAASVRQENETQVALPDYYSRQSRGRFRARP
jgi:hypothetical protein